jgi:hypothetical protein
MKRTDFNFVDDHVHIHFERFIKKNNNIRHDKISNELENVDKKSLNLFESNV